MSAPHPSSSGTAHGILLLDKPEGMTSNAALSRAKRALGIRKAGHTGTLDPLASGLLPLCFGEATKVSAFLLDADKAYVAEMLLGEETRSGDREGECIARAEVPPLTPDDLEGILADFRGEIEQVPPMYSALKYRGLRLHELARAGIDVPRKPRRVVISALAQVDWTPPRLTLRVVCSKGTYIRSLAVDIGRAIGCGAHLSALRRERSGPFTLADAVSLDPLTELDVEAARALLLPPDRALLHLPAVALSSGQVEDVLHGRVATGVDGRAGAVRMYGDDRFLGIGALEESGALRVRRGFRC